MEKKKQRWLPIGIAVIVVAVLVGVSYISAWGAGETEYRVVCLGDSIIGNTRDETSVTSVMERILGEPVANTAFGGTCASLGNTEYRPTYFEDSLNLAELTDAIVYQDFSVQMYDISSNNFGLPYFAEALDILAAVDFEQVEILFIEHGVNDYSAGRPIDNPNNPLDVYTYGGALRYAIETIQQTYPHIQIVLVTPLYCYFQENGERGLDCESADFGYGPLENYVETGIAIAEEYAIPCIDNFHNLGIHSENIDEYAEDGIHLNEKGRKLLADALADFVINYRK